MSGPIDNDPVETEPIERVPRTGAEEALLVRTRPPGWEYLLFGAALLRLENDLEPKWQEHAQRSRRAAVQQLTAVEALDRISSGVFEEAAAIVHKATESMSPGSQELAFGKPGEPGDPQQIEAFAAAIIGGYDGLLEWSARLQAEGVPDVFRAVFDAASDLVELPLHQFRDYVDQSVAEFDRLPAALREGKPIEVTLVLKLSVDDAALEQFQHELDAASERIQHTGGQLVETSSAMSEIDLPAGLGFFEARRAKKAIKDYQEAFAAWKAERDECAELLALAQTYRGEQSAQVVLKSGEAVFALITGASLIEDRRGPGQWQGRSSGVSIPIGSIGGRTIRYRTGSSRGHFMQGMPAPTAIDTGNFYITNQRAIFQGTKQTRECRFDKLVGFQHTADGSTIFSVSNRQKPTRIHYGADLAGWFDFRLDLALAHSQNTMPALLKQLEDDLAAIDAAKPTTPALLPAHGKR